MCRILSDETIESEENQYAEDSISEDDLRPDYCLHHRSCLCFLQSLCPSRDTVYADHRGKQRFVGHSGHGRRIAPVENHADLVRCR